MRKTFILTFIFHNMKKMFPLFLIIVILSYNVSANFVCGSVNDLEEMSVQWFDIKVYYTENPEDKITCKINPENKFCCDLEEIKSVGWKTNKEVNAELIQGNYLAGPVSLTTTDEGYEVFPEMDVEKAITIHSPQRKILINNHSVFVNLSTHYSLNNINYSLSYNGEIVNKKLCENCNTAQFELENLDYGNYNLEIIAFSDKQFKEQLNFSILEYLEFEREFICEKCRRNYIPANTKVNVSLTLKASHNVSGVLYEYVPQEFILDSNITEDYSETHKSISWNVQGKEITENYEITSPNIIFPRKYTFQSEFENFKSEEMEVRVFRFLWFLGYLSYPKRKADYDYKTISRFFRNSDEPIVLNLNESINLIAIYTNTSKKNVFVFTKLKDNDFSILANIKNDDITDILIRLKTRKNESISLYDYSQKKYLNAKKFKEDEGYEYYDFYAEQKGKFRIVKE